LLDMVNASNVSPATVIHGMANIKIQKTGAKDIFYARAPARF